MTKANECTCPSGDGSLRHPCPAHPAAEQAGGDERAAFELFVRKHCGMPEHIAVNWDAKFTNDAWEGWKARAALAQPSQAIAAAPTYQFQSREIGESDWAPCDFRWYLYCSKSPEMDTRVVEVAAQPSPAQAGANVGHGHVFPRADGVKMRCGGPGLCPECSADASRARTALAQPSPASDLDPLNLAPHAEAFNEAPAEALKPEQAEAERPELEPHIPAQTIAEAAIEQLIKSGAKHYQEFHFDLHLDGHEGARPVVVTVAFSDGPSAHELRMKAEQERDAALARVAELTATRNRYGLDAHYFNKNLQRILRDFGSFTPDELARSLIFLAKVADEKVVAQAQHSVPETTNEEANSFLRVADAGQFKDNAAAVRTAAMIIRGLLHRPAIMKSIIRHRIGLTPEYEGQWHADLYDEDGEVQHHAEADTPDEAVRAVVALAAAPGKEG
ncbi:hypothetical protein HPR93_20520 [Pseudomonas aeruginosa]|uniref:hypothetical protein n=1 Tax=Pseudomonas aeruginosa TaxID=287 RepID=UPI0015C580BF|nr:hypothetical protein [Pseudomonas aeruginosa]NPW30301.1 hypothetical protein [Pseudomonas aeruginosa]